VLWLLIANKDAYITMQAQKKTATCRS